MLQSPQGLALTPFLLVHACGLSVLPFLALDPRPISWKRWGIALVIMLAYAAYWSNLPSISRDEQKPGWGFGFILPYGGLFPYCTGMMGEYGAFSGNLVVGDRDLLLGTPIRVFLSLLGCVAGAWLIDRIIDKIQSGRALGSLVLVAGPPGLPADVVAKIGAALDKASSDPEFLKQLETIGATPIAGSTVETFTADVGKEEAYWNQWAKDIGAPLQK